MAGSSTPVVRFADPRRRDKCGLFGRFTRRRAVIAMIELAGAPNLWHHCSTRAGGVAFCAGAASERARP